MRLILGLNFVSYLASFVTVKLNSQNKPIVTQKDDFLRLHNYAAIKDEKRTEPCSE